MSAARSFRFALWALGLAGAACSHHSGIGHDAGSSAGSGGAGSGGAGSGGAGGDTSGAGGTTTSADASPSTDVGGASGGTGTSGASGADAGPNGPDAADAADAKAATRLVPRQLETAGARPLVLGIFDTKEKSSCRFVFDTTGTLRCLPPTPSTLYPTSTFADAGCKKPLFEIGQFALAAVPAGTVVSLPPVHKDCVPDRFDVGTLTPWAGDTEWFGPTCTPQPSTVTAGYARVTAGPVALDRWATGTIVDGPLVAGRLRIAQVETADGARFDDHAVDTRWAKTCDLNVKLGSCVPPTVPATSTFFGDDRCMTSPLFEPGACGDSVFIAPTASAPARALGARWTGGVFVKHNSCQAEPATFAQDRPVFAAGAVLDGDAVMPVTWTAAGTGRVRARELANGAAASVPVANTLSWNSHYFSEPRFHDEQTGTDCNPVWTPEGAVHCVPTTVKRVTPGFFADAACKTPAFLCYDADCATTPAMILVGDFTIEWHASSIIKLVAVPNAFSFVGSTCTQGISMATFTFSAGAAVPWDTYPTLTEVNAR